MTEIIWRYSIKKKIGIDEVTKPIQETQQSLSKIWQTKNNHPYVHVVKLRNNQQKEILRAARVKQIGCNGAMVRWQLSSHMWSWKPEDAVTRRCFNVLKENISQTSILWAVKISFKNKSRQIKAKSLPSAHLSQNKL